MAPLPIPMGNVPEWGLLLIGLRSELVTLTNRVRDFTQRVRDESRLENDEIKRRLEADELVAQAVEIAMNGFTGPATERKRQRLARAAAAAITGTGLARPDELPILLKTMAGIEDPHVQLLALITDPQLPTAELSGTRIEGAKSEFDLIAAWPDVENTVGPLLSALVREDLIRNVGGNMYATQITGAYATSQYGRRFLEFLEISDLSGLDLQRAEVVARYENGNPPQVVVRNLGPCTAREIRLSIPIRDEEPLVRPDSIRLILGPGSEEAIQVEAPTLTKAPPYKAHIEWEDLTGMRARDLRIGGTPNGQPAG